MSTPYAPVAPAERMHTLDVLRGAALLGILLMNVMVFGLPFEAYATLPLWGGQSAADTWTFAVQWTLFEGKMRALFSMMFGAGIVVFLGRAAARHDSVAVADLYGRRMLWLLLFGVLHAWLIWHGDILAAYAPFALLIFPLRNLSPRALFLTAGAALLVVTALFTADAFHKQQQQAAALQAVAAERRGMSLTEEQRDAKQEWTDTYNEQRPSRAALQEEVDNYRSGYLGQLRERAIVLRQWHFLPIYFPVFADFWGLMLIGMALYKLGILQGERSSAFYVRLAVIAYGVGIPVNAASTYFMLASNFDLVTSAFANAPHQVGRVAIALGHAAVIILVVKHGRAAWMTRPLAAVGQMALTNYIGTSLLCSLIFYAPGLALIGQLPRHQLYYVVAAVWIINLTFSVWWLGRFRFGPLEWCWRSLTYWQRQPMRRPAEVLGPHAIV